MSDVRDILDLDRAATPEVTKETILGTQEKVKRKALQPKVVKRPEGMHREVFALLCNDNKDGPPLFPTDAAQGYKQTKAQLGMRSARPWVWMQFNNPARSDGASFRHWRRKEDEGKEYPFAKFNKKITVPTYTDAEYMQHLQVETWTRKETDHLFSLCRRFDLRFVVMQDRWDRSSFMEKTVEDMKERYYDICNILAKVQTGPSYDAKTYVFDADHERRRKEQLIRLYDRTTEQIEEEQSLVNELRKIEARKKEREKKQQDLQKLITAADNQTDVRKIEKKVTKKKLQHQTRPRIDSCADETARIKFPDMRNVSIFLRSQCMKLPASVGQKKLKAIEQMLQELGTDMLPMPTEEICVHFNDLRSDMVLLFELKSALATCEFELQTLKHQYEALNPGKAYVPSAPLSAEFDFQENDTSTQKGISEIIDVVGSPGTSGLVNPSFWGSP